MNRLAGPAVTKDMIMTSRVVETDEGIGAFVGKGKPRWHTK